MQPQLVLLQKTLLNIEGLGRQLYPELDLWKTASPCCALDAGARQPAGSVARSGSLVAPRRARDRPARYPPSRSASWQPGARFGHSRDAEAVEARACNFLVRTCCSDRVIVGGVLFITAAVWLGMRLVPLWIGAGLGASALLVWVWAWALRVY